MDLITRILEEGQAYVDVPEYKKISGPKPPSSMQEALYAAFNPDPMRPTAFTWVFVTPIYDLIKYERKYLRWIKPKP